MAVRRAAAVLALGTIAAADCRAQGQLSEHGVTAQTVAGTTITVEYHRPVARGRSDLFGGVVPWGENWTPGANWATTVDVDRDLRVEGQTLPKGKYSLWMIVRQDGWTIDFHRRVRLFHTVRPDSSDVQLRLRVRPDSGPHTEVLTFDFPEIAGATTTLRLRWGKVVVPLHLVVVAPPLNTAMSSTARAPYVGDYDLEILASTTGGAPIHLKVSIAEQGETLHWRDMSGPEAQRRDFVLMPGEENEFTRARRAPDGQYWPDAGATITFSVSNGRATGYEVEFDGTVVSRAKRLP